MRLLSAIACLCVVLFSATRTAATPVEAIAPWRFVVDVSGFSLEIPFASSLPNRASVERIVVVIHGSGRNADDYFQRVGDALATLPNEVGRTLVIAPQFLKEEDIDHWGLPSQMLYWSGGWRTGSKSFDTIENPRPARISSYAVLDQLLELLLTPSLYPNLTGIVVVGHSAGGQFVNRYAAATNVPDLPGAPPFRFVVANAGTYLYMSPKRGVTNALGYFAVPSATEQAACPGWDDYKYGLEQLNSYMSSTGPSQLISNFQSREVRYLLGELDTGVVGLDISCEAMLQGDQRLERGLEYHAHLVNLFGSSIVAQHQLQIVPSVGHDSEALFASGAGIHALFGLPAPMVPGPTGVLRVVLGGGLTFYARRRLRVVPSR